MRGSRVFSNPVTYKFSDSESDYKCDVLFKCLIRSDFSESEANEARMKICAVSLLDKLMKMNGLKIELRWYNSAILQIAVDTSDG